MAKTVAHQLLAIPVLVTAAIARQVDSADAIGTHHRDITPTPDPHTIGAA
jgi:hypothetical protein